MSFMPLASCTKQILLFLAFGPLSTVDTSMQLAPNSCTPVAVKQASSRSYVIILEGAMNTLDMCLSKGAWMLMQLNCFQTATASCAASPRCKQSLVAPACVDVSAVSNRLCRTASSGHLKINYQITAKRNSCTVTEYEKSGKRMLLGRGKNFFFYTRLFPSKCQSVQNWELAGASSTQQFFVGRCGESGFGAG